MKALFLAALSLLPLSSAVGGDVRVSTIMQLEHIRVGQTALAVHIRRFLESSDGQYYLDAKQMYLSGKVSVGSAEFAAWHDRLVPACPNFRRLQNLADTGIINTSFPFLVAMKEYFGDSSSTLGSTGSDLAFSSPNFPWYQMLSNIPDYAEAIKAGYAPLMPEDAAKCLKIASAVWVLEGGVWSPRQHTWGADIALDDALRRADAAVTKRISAGEPMCPDTPSTSPSMSPGMTPSVMAASGRCVPIEEGAGVESHKPYESNISDTIRRSAGPAEALDTLGIYHGYWRPVPRGIPVCRHMDFQPFITTGGISRADARANCELNAASNPDRSVRCLWNDEEILHREVSPHQECDSTITEWGVGKHDKPCCTACAVFDAATCGTPSSGVVWSGTEYTPRCRWHPMPLEPTVVGDGMLGTEGESMEKKRDSPLDGKCQTAVTELCQMCVNESLFGGKDPSCWAKCIAEHFATLSRACGKGEADALPRVLTASAEEVSRPLEYQWTSGVVSTAVPLPSVTQLLLIVSLSGGLGLRLS